MNHPSSSGCEYGDAVRDEAHGDVESAFRAFHEWVIHIDFLSYSGEEEEHDAPQNQYAREHSAEYLHMLAV